MDKDGVLLSVYAAQRSYGLTVQMEHIQALMSKF